ncbi:hypothetical protein D3C73_862870 [compost metagenome]
MYVTLRSTLNFSSILFLTKSVSSVGKLAFEGAGTNQFKVSLSLNWFSWVAPVDAVGLVELLGSWTVPSFPHALNTMLDVKRTTMLLLVH